MSALWKRLAGTRRDMERHPPLDSQLLEKAETLIAAGHVLEDRGNVEAALEQYRQSALVASAYPRAHMNVGNALAKLDRHDEAAAALRQAITCDPAYAPARFNLGSLLAVTGDLKTAETELKEVLRLQPAMYQAALVLADIFETEERFDEAEFQLLYARQIAPDHAGTLLNHGTFCFRRDRFDEAMQLFQRVKELQPDFTDAESSLLFAANFRTDLHAATIADEHRRVGRLIQNASGAEYKTWSNSCEPERRLRIGYVSGDFLNHPIALFLRPVLEMHDTDRFAAYCYSNHNYANPVADALRERADHWRNIADVDDGQVADVIRKDAIDILVDLSGHTRRNRLSVFSRRPAPVQVSWLGYLNTTGLSTMDYRIVDAYTDPIGETEHLHTEKLVRMPHTQWCYAPWYIAPPVCEPHAARPDALVLGSFNQFRKISDPCLSLWCEVLKQLPNAELLVLDVKNAELQKSFLNRIARHGVDPARVTTSQRTVILEYFATIGNVDVGLDTFPYNGATTTLDTLWMGVPVVGLQGDRGISRGTYSILRTLGLSELIAKSHTEFVDLNIRLSTDASWRAHLRHTLRERLLESPLMDAAGFTRDLELRYREIWRTWCARQSEELQTAPNV